MFGIDNINFCTDPKILYFIVLFLLVTALFYKVQTHMDSDDSGLGDPTDLTRSNSTDSIISVREIKYFP